MEYWSIGALEYWGIGVTRPQFFLPCQTAFPANGVNANQVRFRTPLLHYSITPLLLSPPDQSLNLGQTILRSAKIWVPSQHFLELRNRLFQVALLEQSIAEVVAGWERAGVDFQGFLKLGNCLVQLPLL